MEEEISGYIFYEGFKLRNMQVHQLKGSTGRWDLGNWHLHVLAGKGCVWMYMYIHLPCTQHQSVFHWCVLTPNGIENDHLKVVSSQFSHSHMHVGTSSNIKLTLLYLYNMLLKLNNKRTSYCSLLRGRKEINYKRDTHCKHQSVSKNTHN